MSESPEPMTVEKAEEAEEALFSSIEETQRLESENGGDTNGGKEGSVPGSSASSSTDGPAKIADAPKLLQAALKDASKDGTTVPTSTTTSTSNGTADEKSAAASAGATTKESTNGDGKIGASEVGEEKKTDNDKPAAPTIGERVSLLERCTHTHTQTAATTHKHERKKDWIALAGCAVDSICKFTTRSGDDCLLEHVALDHNFTHSAHAMQWNAYTPCNVSHIYSFPVLSCPPPPPPLPITAKPIGFPLEQGLSVLQLYCAGLGRAPRQPHSRCQEKDGTDGEEEQETQKGRVRWVSEKVQEFVVR